MKTGITILICSLICLMIFGSLVKTNDPIDPSKLEPFKVIISSADYSMSYSLETTITNTGLQIVFKGGVEGEKDSLIFSKALLPSEELSKISRIKLGSLKDRYSNDCVLDGSQIMVEMTTNAYTKKITLSNHYQQEIGTLIKLANSLVPSEYKTSYEKKQFTDDFTDCSS